MGKTWHYVSFALLLICIGAMRGSDASRSVTPNTEAALLRDVHEHLLQLQLTELALKNRRDLVIERDLTAAIDQASATRAFARSHREELPSLEAESSREAYAALHEALGERRYDVYSRLQAARRMILRLNLSDGAMGAADETISLYNHILQNLYDFGISIAPGEAPAHQGILFGATPTEAASRYQQLRITSEL